MPLVNPKFSLYGNQKIYSWGDHLLSQGLYESKVYQHTNIYFSFGWLVSNT